MSEFNPELSSLSPGRRIPREFDPLWSAHPESTQLLVPRRLLVRVSHAYASGTTTIDSHIHHRVISCITSAIVFFFLALHWAVDLRSRKKRQKDEVHVNRQVRVSGRHFMLSTTFFLGLIAVAALIFSRIVRLHLLK